MQQVRSARIDLQLADEHLARAATVEREVDKMAASGPMPDLLQRARVDCQRSGLHVVSVKNRGHLTTPAQRMHVLACDGPACGVQQERGGHRPATLPALRRRLRLVRFVHGCQ